MVYLNEFKSFKTFKSLKPPPYILPRVAGETFYAGCQVPFGNFVQAAWRIFCLVMLARW